jgi:hypothetical protein
MKHFKNVSSIQFELTLNGEGCVNFDSAEQLEFLRSVGIVKYNDPSFYNKGKALTNVLFSKKNFRRSEVDGTTEFHVKVSSECLRNAIFKTGMPSQSPTIMNILHVLYGAIAHPDSLIRGYMYADKKGTIRKKSPLYLTDAEEQGAWRTAVATDFHSRSGEKESNKGKNSDDPKDNSIYKIENVGAITYKANGGIDVQEMGFISADPVYDRMAVNVDGGVNEQIYLDVLSKNLNIAKPEFKYYYLNNSYTADEWAERGILLDNISVDKLIKRTFKNMLDINIIRRNAYLKTNTLVVTVFADGGSETIEVTNDNIDEFYFDCITNYVEASMDKIQANKKMVESLSEKAKDEKK